VQYDKSWNPVPRKEWTHRFINTLDTIPNNWYLELEMFIEITYWDYITQIFQVTFAFQNDSPLINTMLQVIKQKIFTKEE